MIVLAVITESKAHFKNLRKMLASDKIVLINIKHKIGIEST